MNITLEKIDFLHFNCIERYIALFFSSFYNIEMDSSVKVNNPGFTSKCDQAFDAEDVRQSRNGDSEAYKRIIDKYQSGISRIIWRFTQNLTTHEELVQDVFVQAYLSLHSYQAKAPFEHWLAKIATRTGYKYWKQKQTKRKQLTFTFAQWDEVVDEKTTSSHIKASQLICEILETLPCRDRLVLTLRYLEQCDVRETAFRTGWSQAMVKVQTHRAKKKLRKLFIQNGMDVKT